MQLGVFAMGKMRFFALSAGFLLSFLFIKNSFACNASVHFYVKNECPWPVTFTKNYNGVKSTYTLDIGKSADVGEYTEKTLSFSDTYGDQATVWLHSEYHFPSGCKYHYTPRSQASIGYGISSKTWSGSTPDLTLTSCRNGAQAQIETIGLGPFNVTRDGLLQPQSNSINIKAGNTNTYKINFTNSATSCSFKLGQGISCSRNDIGSLFTEGKLIFACQQVNPKQGQCQWISNSQKSTNYSTINVYGNS